MPKVVATQDKAQCLADSLDEMSEAFEKAEMGHGFGWGEVCKQAASILRQQTCASKPVAWLEEVTLTSGNRDAPFKEWRVTQNPSTSDTPRKPLYLAQTSKLPALPALLLDMQTERHYTIHWTATGVNLPPGQYELCAKHPAP